MGREGHREGRRDGSEEAGDQSSPLASESRSAASLDLDGFPIVADEDRPRELYFNKSLSELDEAALKNRGYWPRYLMAMPRRSEAEQRVYLLAKAQGIEEKTIWATPDDLDELRLEMQAYGLFNQKSTRLSLNVKVGQDDVKQLLSWGKDRHTLRDNTTIVGISDLMLDDRIDDEVKAKVKEVERFRTLMHKKGEDSKRKKGSKADAAIPNRDRSIPREESSGPIPRGKGRPPMGS